MIEALLLAFTLAGVLDIALKVLVFLALLSALVVFHEFGHFVFAKMAGVTVTDFAVGFGPSIVAVRRGDTTYRLNLLPLGGYCKMVGEDTADDGSADPGNFQRKSVGARLAIIAAGPLFNLALAVIIFASLAAISGIATGATNVVDSVKPDSPAARAGLQPGDAISVLDGTPVRSGDEMVSYIHAHPGKTMTVEVLRAGKPVQLVIRAEPVDVDGQKMGQFGFVPKPAMEHKGALDDIGFGFSMVGKVVALNLAGVGEAIRNHDSSVIHGPVGIGRIVAAAEDLGVLVVLSLAAQLSTMLGVINLFPFPALDGGRLVFILVELVRGKPVDPEKEGLVHLTGFALLMMLIVFVTYHDILAWVQGKGVL